MSATAEVKITFDGIDVLHAFTKASPIRTHSIPFYSFNYPDFAYRAIPFIRKYQVAIERIG
jgi:hypothetical protein